MLLTTESNAPKRVLDGHPTASRRTNTPTPPRSDSRYVTLIAAVEMSSVKVPVVVPESGVNVPDAVDVIAEPVAIAALQDEVDAVRPEERD